jgi:hypothetical protein
MKGRKAHSRIATPVQGRKYPFPAGRTKAGIRDRSNYYSMNILPIPPETKQK